MCLGTYGKAQAIFVGHTAALDAILLVRAVVMLDRFALLIADGDPNAVTNLFQYFKPEDLDNLHQNLDTHGRVLQEIAQCVDAVAPTVNHCDLIPNNALCRQREAFVL